MRGAVSIFVSIALCLVAASAIADPSAFHVDSYIPQRFTDLQWRIGANASLSGSSGQIDRDLGYLVALTPNESGGDRQYIELTSDHAYRYETARTFLNAKISTSIYADRSHSDRDNARDTRYSDGSGYSEIVAAVSDVKLWSGRGWGSGSFGRYVAGALFVGGDGLVAYSYRSQTGDEVDRSSQIQYTATDSLTRQLYSTEQHTAEINSGYNSSGALNVGYGRIYEGIYAADALNIIGQLKRDKLIDAEPTYDQMVRLTDLVYRERNAYTVDSRLRRIEALTNILEFLDEEGILRNPGPLGTLLLQDVWDFFPRTSRKFGWRLSGGVGGRYSRSRSDDSKSGPRFLLRTLESSNTGVLDTLSLDDYDFYYHGTARYVTREIYLQAQVAYYRPINQYWQLDLIAASRYWVDAKTSMLVEQYQSTTTQNKSTTLSNLETHDWIDWSVSPTLRYLFDSRTTASLGASIGFVHWERESQDGNDQRTYETLVCSFTPSLVYRIAVPSEMRASFRFQYSDINDNSDGRSTWSYGLNFSIDHYLY